MKNNSLLERIINLREQHDWTQAELGKRLGLDKSVMNKIENGTRKIQTEELVKLGNLFGVSVDYLLHGKSISSKNISDIPSWATNQDVLDIEKAIKDNVPMNYDGIELDEEDRAQIDRVIRAVMWEKLEARKKEKNDEQK